MYLNHLKNIPPPLVYGKFIFQEINPRDQKCWAPLLGMNLSLTEIESIHL